MKSRVNAKVVSNVQKENKSSSTKILNVVIMKKFMLFSLNVLVGLVNRCVMK